MEYEKVYFGHNCNTYILGKKGSKCVVIDPGFNQNNCLVNYIKNNYSGVTNVLLTHGHYDHILATESLVKAFDCNVMVSFEDEELLSSSKKNCAFMANLELEFHDLPIKNIYDGEILNFDNFKLRVISTPFHTEGSVCLANDEEKVIFTGDTLFHLSIGRFDLPTSNPRKVFESLNKLKKIDGQYKVFPGHGESTTIENELKFNTYLKK